MNGVKGICPICNNVIDVNLKNQANICPICKQAYISQVAVETYNSHNNNIVDLDTFVVKVKRLLTVNMISEALETAEQVQKLYPDKYQSWLLKILIYTQNYSNNDFENIPLTWELVQKVEKLRQLDNINDIEFQQWYQRYKQWIFNNDLLFQLCNQIAPLKAFEILQVYKMKRIDGYSSQWQDGDFYIYEKFIDRDTNIVDVFYEAPGGCGLTLTYIYKEKDYRFTGRYSYTKMRFKLKMAGSTEEKIPILKREIKKLQRTSSCCPYCGESNGIFGNCHCHGKKTNEKFYWMRKK